MSNKGTHPENLERDQESPKEGVATLAENDQAMTPDGEPGTASEDPTGEDGGGLGTQGGTGSHSENRTTPQGGFDEDPAVREEHGRPRREEEE